MLLILAGQLPKSLGGMFVQLANGSGLGMAPPVCVASPTVSKFEWSESGRWILAESMILEPFNPITPTNAKYRVVLIDPVTKKSTVLMERPLEKRAGDVSFVPGDLLLVSEVTAVPSGPDRAQPGMRHVSTLRDPASTRSWTVYDSGVLSPEKMVFPYVLVSKKGYAVIVVQSGTGEEGVQFLDLNSNTRKPLALGFRAVGFDAEGYLGQPVYKDRKLTGQFNRVMPDGSLSLVEFKPPKEEPHPEFSLMMSGAVQKLGKKAEALSGWWLAAQTPSDHQFAMVAADAKQAEVSPDQKRIAYLTDGNLFIRDLVNLSKADFEELLIREEQNELMMKAKQVATGIMIFCADSDDVFPAQEGFNEKIMPYLKNESLLNGFTYTFSAKKATEIADPAGTVIGYAQGRRGRAVAYADGHVKWIKNP